MFFGIMFRVKICLWGGGVMGYYNCVQQALAQTIIQKASCFIEIK